MTCAQPAALLIELSPQTALPPDLRSSAFALTAHYSLRTTRFRLISSPRVQSRAIHRFIAPSADEGYAELAVKSFRCRFYANSRSKSFIYRFYAFGPGCRVQPGPVSIHATLAVDYFAARSLDAEEKLLDNTVTQYEQGLVGLCT